MMKGTNKKMNNNGHTHNDKRNENCKFDRCFILVGPIQTHKMLNTLQQNGVILKRLVPAEISQTN